MKFDISIADSQSHKYHHWHIIYSPTLSLDWLQLLLDFGLPSEKDDDKSILKIDDSSLVLKRVSDIGTLVSTLYKKTSLKQVIGNRFAHSHAKRCWYFAHYLRIQGLSTPEPLAYIEEKKMGFVSRSWYICRFDDGMSCADYFLHAPSFTPAMVNTVSAIVDMFITLGKSQLTHGNIKANNLLLSTHRLSLIDLRCMKYHPDRIKAQKMWRRDIGSFMTNWRERFDIERQFRLAFSKHGIEV